MKRSLMLLLATAMIATLAGAASAGTPSVDRRQWRQHVRIRDGVRDCDLTRAERLRLRAGQRHVRQMEWRAKYDGRVTLRERARLQRALDRQSRMIYRLRHNGRRC